METIIWVLGILGYLGIIAAMFWGATFAVHAILDRRKYQKTLIENDGRYRSFHEVVVWYGSSFPILKDILEFTETESLNPGNLRDKLKEKYGDKKNDIRNVP